LPDPHDHIEKTYKYLAHKYLQTDAEPDERAGCWRLPESVEGRKKMIRASDAKEEGVGNPLKKRPDTRIKNKIRTKSEISKEQIADSSTSRPRKILL